MGSVNLGRVQGSTWYSGTLDSVEDIEQYITDAVENDFYLNKENGNYFHYTINNGTLKWLFCGCFRGQQGEKGDKGERGEVGEVGAIGQQGPVGKSGTKLTMRGEWEVGVQYRSNDEYIDLVCLEGNTYICKASHTSTEQLIPPSAHWQLAAAKGDKGEVGEAGITLLSTSTPINATIQAGHALVKTAAGTVGGKAMLELSGGTMQGILVAQNNIQYRMKQVRNIVISNEEPSSGDNGDIWIQYEE